MSEINVENQQMFNAENKKKSICVDIKKAIWEIPHFLKSFI